MSGVLMLHGALGSSADFEQLKAMMDVEVVDMDFIGHGHSGEVGEQWTIELFASQLERFIESMPKPLPIFGYSMGGYVALWLSMSRPDLTPRILTLGTKLDWQSPDVNVSIPLIPSAPMQGLMQALNTRPLLTLESVQNITVPVRYMVGDRDSMVSLEETVRFYKATPGSELTVLPNTKHSIHKVDVRRLLGEIQEFLAGADQTDAS